MGEFGIDPYGMGPLPGMGPLGIYGLPGFGLASGLNARGVRTRGLPITG